eukprot:1035623-Pleurochrysis_carterae.AAC.3
MRASFTADFDLSKLRERMGAERCWAIMTVRRHLDGENGPSLTCAPQAQVQMDALQQASQQYAHEHMHAHARMYARAHLHIHTLFSALMNACARTNARVHARIRARPRSAHAHNRAHTPFRRKALLLRANLCAHTELNLMTDSRARSRTNQARVHDFQVISASIDARMHARTYARTHIRTHTGTIAF